MPQVIRTPEQYFREEGKAMHLLTLSKREQGRDENSGRFMFDWVAEHLPETRIERIGPSERSGWMLGLCSVWLAIHLTPDTFDVFRAAWLNIARDSTDARFRYRLVPLPANPQDYAKREEDWD